MGVAERIAHKVESLPADKQAEVLDFVEFLAARAASEHDREDRAFGNLALAQALRGEDDDPVHYGLADCVETWP